MTDDGGNIMCLVGIIGLVIALLYGVPCAFISIAAMGYDDIQIGTWETFGWENSTSYIIELNENNTGRLVVNNMPYDITWELATVLGDYDIYISTKLIAHVHVNGDGASMYYQSLDSTYRPVLYKVEDI